MSLKLSRISKQFEEPETDRKVPALSDVDLTVESGQFVSVIGPSGCGKSTLLRVVAGLETATSGTVLVNGSVQDEPWRQIGFVFQEYALFPWRTVLENIAFGMEIKGVERRVRTEQAREYIRQFGLEGFEGRYPSELSGGMRQRVAIARTMINRPAILLMDEPFGALDSQTRALMQQFLMQVWQQSRTTIVLITHDIDEAVFLSQRIYGMSNRPGTLKLDIEVALPYPRRVTSDDFNGYRRRILDFLNSQNRNDVSNVPA